MTENEHQNTINNITKVLQKLQLPTSIPPHTVHNLFYHPDMCTRINHRFVTIEIINTSYGFDVLGQLSLLLQKDTVEYAVCIITNKLIESDKEKYISAVKEVQKLNHYCKLNGELILLPEDKFETWITHKTEESQLWKPNNKP